MRRLPAAAMLSAGLLAAPALAQERPPLFPTRDVDVTYRLPAPDPAAGGGRVLEQRVRFSAASRRQRVDPPTAGTYFVLDYATHRMATVRPAAREVIDMANGEADAAATPYVRHGEATVAGFTCTEWWTRDAAREAAAVCLTPDGVLLRAVAAGRLLLEATRVSYAAQDASVFAVPEGFSHLEAPAGR